MKLYICEKPSQARDIAKHVGARSDGRGCKTGQGVAVTWCIGHLLEQAPPEAYVPEAKNWDINVLPVIPPQWKMEVKSGVKEQFAAVKALLGQASEVVIATDADREGEVIAREVMQLCGYRGPVNRLWLGALDDASVKKALAKVLPGSKTEGMYYSCMGRARADWLAGMNLTMALTKAFGTGGKGGVLSCGRVQTPTLGLIVRRERSILNFVPKAYYVLDAAFEMRGAVVPMSWQTPKELLDKDGHILKKEVVEAVASKVRGKAGRITSVQTTQERELAPLLYSLGSLQQEASRRYGIKAQAVLDACQGLYEKHKATTYPRTDCEYLPMSQFEEVQGVLQALAKTDSSLSVLVRECKTEKAPRSFNDKQITAHHAIIPTANGNVSLSAMSLIERKVYDLIRRRYFAQFLGNYEFNKTVIALACESEHFAAEGKTPLFMGWKRAYEGVEEAKPSKAKEAKDSKAEQGDDAPKNIVIPAVKEGDLAINRKADTLAKKTTPPKRYTEGTLLAAMENIAKEIDDPRLKAIMQNKEKAGIGTDATRAEVIETLFRREFVAQEKKNLVPTPKGMQLIELIEKIDPSLADPVLTAYWEERLTQVEKGQFKLEQFEAEVATWLTKLIQTIKAKAGSAQIGTPRAQSAGGGAARSPLATGYTCPKCQKSKLNLNGKKLECNSSCGFGLWVEVAGKALDKGSIEALLAGRSTAKLEGFKSKEGRAFAAKLQLDAQDWKVKYLFEQQPLPLNDGAKTKQAYKPPAMQGGEVFLKVSFDDKDKVKALGARWNGERKAWYVPSGVDAGLFRQWV